MCEVTSAVASAVTHRHDKKLLTKKHLRGSLVHQVQQQGVGVQDQAVVAPCDHRGDFLGSVDAAQLHETWVLLDGGTDHLGRLGFSLSTDHDAALVLDRLLDDETCALRLLLSHLLGLDGAGELTAELQVCDGDILQDDVELGSTLSQVLPDLARHLLTLGEQLRGVELGDDLLQSLVGNGWQNLIIIVCKVHEGI